jgi:hypothetical protein
MATIETLRTDPAAGGPEAAASTAPALGAFRSGREEERLADLLAFALAVEATEPPTPENVDRLRRRAQAELTDHAFRLLHNRVEEIRREAVSEALGRMPAPPGLATLVIANLLALVLAAAALFGANAMGWLAPARAALGI